MRLASVGRAIPQENPCQVTLPAWSTDPPPEAKHYGVRTKPPGRRTLRVVVWVATTF